MDRSAAQFGGESISNKATITCWWIVLLLWAGFAFAQCPANDATLPQSPFVYPMTSDQYSVQYQIGNGSLTTAKVYVSYYGKTNASPLRGDAPYVRGTTSMSFVSIPAQANASVTIHVTRLAGPFRAADHVSVRPTPAGLKTTTLSDGTAQLSATTTANFNGEQFILWWNRGTDSAGVEGLAIYLNPPYVAPTASGNVKMVNSWSDLSNLSGNIDTLDFEGTVALQGTGAAVYAVPNAINTIYLGPNAWVQGKLAFTVKNNTTRKIYGPGVLDNSLFNYLNRNCSTDDGTYSLSSLGANGNLTNLVVDGIIISDMNHAANDPFFSSTLNNLKILGWNSNNAALRVNDGTKVSNTFIRSSDDSLMLWGSPVSATNITVWQGYNGGVVNVGWSNNSLGDGNLVDGLWVVKGDWWMPASQSWLALSQPGPPNPLASQNNAVFASLMVPSTMYGKASPPVFRNIYIEDPPQVLFSLKIAPSVNCPVGFCTADFLKASSYVALKIQNLFAPQLVVENSIGFQTLPAGYMANGTDAVSSFPSPYTLTGTMNIELDHVLIKLPSGFVLPLTNAFDAAGVGKISMNGSGVNVKYSLGVPRLREKR